MASCGPDPPYYAATFILLRIDDRKAGRELMERVSKVVASAANPTSPAYEAAVSVAVTFWGLKAAGSAGEFACQFSAGVPAGDGSRAPILADRGESSPEHWEKPLGTPDVHVVLARALPRCATARGRAGTGRAYHEMTGIKAIWRQDCRATHGARGIRFRDGISHPAVEGSGIPGSNPKEPPLKAGEIVLGYQDESGSFRHASARGFGPQRHLRQCSASYTARGRYSGST